MFALGEFAFFQMGSWELSPYGLSTYGVIYWNRGQKQDYICKAPNKWVRSRHSRLNIEYEWGSARKMQKVVGREISGFVKFPDGHGEGEAWACIIGKRLGFDSRKNIMFGKISLDLSCVRLQDFSTEISISEPTWIVKSVSATVSVGSE